jgi:hypothetical protein
LVVGIVRVWCILSVADVIDGMRSCSEAFLIERAGDESGYPAPVAFRFGEYGTRTDGCTLSVVLLSAVPALAGANSRCSRCERIGVLLVWFRVWVGSVPCYYLGLVCPETVRCIGVVRESEPD